MLMRGVKLGSSCWWFRNPANQLRLVACPIFLRRDFYIPRWWSPDFWTINSHTPFLSTAWKKSSNKKFRRLEPQSWQELKQKRGRLSFADTSFFECARTIRHSTCHFRIHLFIDTYYRFIDYRNNNPKQGRFWLAALHRNIGVREFLPKKLRRDQGGKGIVNEKRVIESNQN